MAVLDKQRVTIGVIRKNAYKDILKNFAQHYHVALLRTIGYDYVVRIEAL
jgi:hypothetical protein